MFTVLAVTSQSEQHSCSPSTGCCNEHSSSVTELLTSIICSIVTTVYMLDSESVAGQPVQTPAASAQGVFQGRHLDSLPLHPSAGAMFGSCLVLGCSVSSFLYRHAHDDPYQASLFVVNVVGAIAVGEMTGASFNMILLGYLPWALCIAMFWILCGKALARSMEARHAAATEVVDEKTFLLLWP